MTLIKRMGAIHLRIAPALAHVASILSMMIRLGDRQGVRAPLKNKRRRRDRTLLLRRISTRHEGSRVRATHLGM